MTSQNVTKQVWLMVTIVVPMTLWLATGQTKDARFAYLIDVGGYFLKVNLT